MERIGQSRVVAYLQLCIHHFFPHEILCLKPQREPQDLNSRGIPGLRGKEKNADMCITKALVSCLNWILIVATLQSKRLSAAKEKKWMEVTYSVEVRDNTGEELLGS